MEIHIGNYRASDETSFLSYLDKVSQYRNDGGLLHGGHIHFIQNKLSDENDFCFLKAAITGVLDCVPNIWSLDLPEQVENGNVKRLTDDQADSLNILNSKLLLPITPDDVVRVIVAAREYVDLCKEE